MHFPCNKKCSSCVLKNIQTLPSACADNRARHLVSSDQCSWIQLLGACCIHHAISFVACDGTIKCSHHKSENPCQIPPFSCRFCFYISRPFRRYLNCLNRTIIEKVSFSRYASRLIGYRIGMCHLVESEWSQIWGETFSIKMSGACPPLFLTSLSLVCFL